MTTLESLGWRYAVKKFDDTKTISNDKIEILKQAFNLTATSYGLQPIKLLVIKNKELQNKLVEHSFNQQQVEQASHLLVIATQKDLSKEDIDIYFNRIKSIRNTPDEVLNPFKEFLSNDVENRTKDQITNWMKSQAYIALGNLLTVCAIEQIDSCPMEGFSAEKYNEILDLNNQNLIATLVLPVGVRANDDYMKDLKKVRKNIEESVIEIS